MTFESLKIDVPLLKALKDINYDGYLSMEVGFHTRQAEPDWYAKKSIDFLRGKVKQIYGDRREGQPLT